MSTPSRYSTILSIYPNSRGFAFVLFEGALTPVDWGVVEVREKNKNRECISRISALFGRYEPAAIVLQDMSGARRARRIRSLNEAIAVLAETQGIPTFAFSPERVRERFQHFGAPTKHYIAKVIAKHVPAFGRYVPPRRKIWKSEDARMGLFDAVALGLTFFQASERLKDRTVLA